VQFKLGDFDRLFSDVVIEGLDPLRLRDSGNEFRGRRLLRDLLRRLPLLTQLPIIAAYVGSVQASLRMPHPNLVISFGGQQSAQNRGSDTSEMEAEKRSPGGCAISVGVDTQYRT
jgi:hypothetical protein